MALNGSQLRSIMADMDAALIAVAKKHGLESLKIAGKATYNSDNFHVKLVGVVQGGKDDAARRYEVNFTAFGGWPPLNTSFIYKKEEYIITGCNATATKIIAKNLKNERTYTFEFDGLLRLLQAQGKYTGRVAPKKDEHED